MKHSEYIEYFEKNITNKIYVLELISIYLNYPYKRQIRKGGIIGYYSTKEKAENRKNDMIQKINDLKNDDFVIYTFEKD